MRRVLGGVVLIAGVGGLGWVASTNQAVQMERTIAAAADDILSDNMHGLTATVSGRDITAAGISEQAEIDALRPQLDAIAGRRVVSLDDVVVLPVVSPFEMTGSIDANGITAAGVIPVERLREELLPVAGDAVNNLQLADGEPDGDWAQAALDTFESLELLKNGSFRLTDQELVVAGLAATPDDLTRFDEAMASIPGHYTLVTDIEVEDDGTPMRLDLNFDRLTLRGTGKVPVDLDANNIAMTGAERDVDIVQGKIPADHESWTRLAETGVMVLDRLGNGTFSIEDRAVSITGQILPEDQEFVDAAIADMRTDAPDFDIQTDIQPYDDGTPFNLQATFDGSTLTASGKVPSDFGDGLDDNLLATETVSEIETALINDDAGTWPAIAHAGLNALATLEQGTLDITGETITLTGTSQSPQAFEATTAALGDFTSEGEVTFIDDGTPIALALTYSTDGASVSGKLPADLTPADISDALGIAVADDGATQSALNSDEDLLAPLLTITDALPEIDSLTFINGADGAQIDAVAAPGVDADQLAAVLATSLGETASVAVVAASDLPANGAKRTNRFTGRNEVFASGYWLPTFDFRSTIEACTAQSDAILAESKVQFLSGSAELDVQSIRAINGLAALVRKCALEAGLFLTVSGHTDNTGDPDANLTLSQARADAVRTAILDRGVAQSAVSAQGFGDTQPIADNDTDAGKAANRRTEFSWVFE